MDEAGEKQGEDDRTLQQRPRSEGGNLAPQWEPGKSGNPAGRPKGVTFGEKLRAKLREKLDPNKGDFEDQLIDRLIDIALRGSPSDALKAIRESLDRIEGTPAKKLEIKVQGESKLIRLVDDEEEADEED